MERNEFRFVEWPVYITTKKFANTIFYITEKFPQQHKFDLGSQLNRSALSILLNIAEGSGKHSDVDFNRFLNISMGSVHETFAGLDLALDHHLLSTEEFGSAKEQLLNIAKQLGGFKKFLKKSE